MRPEETELKKYKAFYKFDTDFASYARLFQSKWRVKNGYPINTAKGSDYGNFMEPEFAKKEKANFLTENIKNLVTEQIPLIRSDGGLISEPRIWNNLLSSQPLCFNLFGEMYYDLDLATRFFHQLFPTRVERVNAIKFEHSPGRRDAKYLGDRSAFDVFVEYRQGEKTGFIGIEVKYAESLNEETKEKAENNYKDGYATLTEKSSLFKPGIIDFLKQPPIAQIWRDHLLSIATRQDYDDGFFVFLFPEGNQQCQEGIDAYQKHLISDNESVTDFYPRYLDSFILTLDEIASNTWTRELKGRYLGLE